MKPTVTLRGIDDVNDMLAQIAPRQAFNIMRATIQGIAGDIAKDAKRNAPEDEGDLRGAIKAKRERGSRGYLLSTVRVNPVAFYWRYLEYGQGPDGEEHAMFLRAVESFRADMHNTFITQFGKKWEAALKRAAKRNGG
jgi:HK97 gp10 family phage protein